MWQSVNDKIGEDMAIELMKRYLCVEDKVFLVTGGAAGVGAGIVRALLTENARVSSVCVMGAWYSAYKSLKDCDFDYDR